MSATNSVNNAPLKSWRLPGGLSVAVWEHVSDRFGRQTAQYSIRVNKRIKGKAEGEFQDSNYLYPEDLPALQWAIDAAHDFILRRMNEAAA